MKDKLTIVKIGGNVINDNVALSSFLADFALIEGLKILIHGGGKKATEIATKIGIAPNLISGRRITDEANLEVVTMVYAGLLNKKIVAQLQQYNCNAIGLSGADANTIKAHKRIVKNVDYGFAGDVDEVNDSVLKIMLKNDLTPVFCAITHDKNGQLLNTNADTIASEVASALVGLYQVELFYCFEKNGVLNEISDDDSVIEKMNFNYYTKLRRAGLISEGMLPKLENCFNALNKGVSKIVIGNQSVIVNTNQKHTSLTL